MATTHKRINTIDRLIDRGEVVEDPVEIRNTMINFYKELYTESEEWRPNFDLMECPTISQEENDWMQRPFTESEVLQCLQLCDGDKAPEELKDFRPISLIGGVYKIISKLITGRLKTVMGKLVDVHQMAFLKGRQIMDAALIANELVDSRVKKKILGILFMEGLNHMIRKANVNGWIKGFKAQTQGNRHNECIPQVLLCKVGFLRDVLLLPALNSGDETVISGLACFLSEIGHAAPSLITEASPEAFVLTDALLRKLEPRLDGQDLGKTFRIRQGMAAEMLYRGRSSPDLKKGQEIKLVRSDGNFLYLHMEVVFS
ncbi:hypothetical protein MTR67_011103 [Solanum verrucosum]|uniref:Reverse transcriptase domain-containing protein n=1 Tax=Solanum verrucosum TaxID=315347 RepID=A0AAF0Q7F6_SOLVR|nr:hypothetical protein MTR67_011103 [Solanum verrucosum]